MYLHIFASQILREMNFWEIYNLKKCSNNFTFVLELYKFQFFFFHGKCAKSLKLKLRTTKVLQMTVFDVFNWSKLISRKIWVAVKFLDFHTVYSVWHLLVQFYGKMMPHSEPVFSKMAEPMNKQKFFCTLGSM